MLLLDGSFLMARVSLFQVGEELLCGLWQGFEVGDFYTKHWGGGARKRAELNEIIFYHELHESHESCKLTNSCSMQHELYECERQALVRFVLHRAAI